MTLARAPELWGEKKNPFAFQDMDLQSYEEKQTQILLQMADTQLARANEFPENSFVNPIISL